MTSFLTKPFRTFKNVRRFLVSLCVVIFVVVGALFLALYNRAEYFQLHRLIEQAEAYGDFIRHTKEWNVDYGGVYVEKKKETDTNIYLRQLGIEPDEHTVNGKVFTIRNHAIMIEEISRRTEMSNGVKLHMSSFTPLNPANSPNGFDIEAYRAFERGSRNFYRIIREKEYGSPVFQYAYPLYTEESCLECHAGKGFVTGSVLGVFSIDIPMAEMDRETYATKLIIVLAFLATTGLLMAVAYFFSWRLVISLDEAQSQLKLLATTDELTGLSNRRTIMRRLDEEFQRSRRSKEPLSVISLDIDYFKQINDSYGHPFGDLVLRNVSELMASSLRLYDIIGRVGGEEFIILAVDTPLPEAVALAERMVTAVAGLNVTDGSRSTCVTISAGVAALLDGDEDIEPLLQRSDAALYRAKGEGRNRVAVDGQVPDIQYSRHFEEHHDH